MLKKNLLIIASAAAVLLIGIFPAQASPSKLACSPLKTPVSNLGTLQVAGPLTQMPSVQWGIEQGCYKKYGLDIKTNVVATTQIGTAGLVGGSYDIAITTPNNLTLANANENFSGVIIAPRHGYLPEEIKRAQVEPFFPNQLLLQTAMIVAKGSPIPVNGWKSLEGKKVAIQSFLSADHAGTALAMAKFGGNFKKTEFLILTSQQMGDALKRGDIDAAVINDPFATQAILAGAKVIGYPNAYFAQPGAKGDASVAVVYASISPIVKSKNLAMKAFAKATLEINGLLNKPENDASYRQTIQNFTNVTAAAAAKVRLPYMVERKLVSKDISYIPIQLNKLGFIRGITKARPVIFLYW